MTDKKPTKAEQAKCDKQCDELLDALSEHSELQAKVARLVYQGKNSLIEVARLTRMPLHRVQLEIAQANTSMLHLVTGNALAHWSTPEDNAEDDDTTADDDAAPAKDKD